MSTTREELTDLGIKLNRQGVPVSRQLCEQLRSLIVSGQLAPGMRLPSSRNLATALQISRPTVSWAFEQLHAEGYLESFSGSGTFVNRKLSSVLLGSFRESSRLESNESLSESGIFYESLEPTLYQLPKAEIDFREGTPDLATIPVDQWRRLLSKHLQHRDAAKLAYSFDPRGCEALRQAISQYVARSRNVHCQPEQVIITSGCVQALNLICRVHINPDDAIALEDPGYHNAQKIFRSYRAKLCPVPVGEHGIELESLFALKEKIKLLYLTPSHQYPLGSYLDLPSRLSVLTWAAQTGSLIIEDDYDGEYRYGSGPVPSLQGLDRTDSVIYIGTFAKVLFPSLRLAYMVVPKRLAHTYEWAKKLCDNHCQMVEQYALADFIEEGLLERHAHKMRGIYEKRRQVMLSCIREFLGDQVQILGENAGLHVTLRLPDPINDDQVLSKCAELGVRLKSTKANYLLDSFPGGEFLLGYANVDESAIREGVRRLASVVGGSR